jgi:group I intron endonuclease
MFDKIYINCEKIYKGVYCILNLNNNKFYIGSSKDILTRFNTHVFYLNKNKHINKKLQNAWNKYKLDNFDFFIIEECENFIEREQYYLDKYKPHINGYNISDKSNGGDIYTLLSDEDKQKFKNKCKKYGIENGMFNKKHNIDSIQKMKDKSIKRYSLNWFIEKYGNDIGLEKYNNRLQFLKNRNINYIHDNKLKGKKRNSYKTKGGRKDLSNIEDNLKVDIISGNYTIKQLENKYKISKPTILDRKRKYISKN